MPASRGGTGYTSLSSLKSALGISDSVDIVSGQATVPGNISSDYSINIGFRPRMVILCSNWSSFYCFIEGSYLSYGSTYNSGGYVWASDSWTTSSDINSTGFSLSKTWYKAQWETTVYYVAIGY